MSVPGPRERVNCPRQLESCGDRSVTLEFPEHVCDGSITQVPCLSQVTCDGVDLCVTCVLGGALECSIAWDVQRVTVASTIGVYGGVPDLRGVSEELPLHMAGNVVAASKKSAELAVSLFRERGVDAVSVRLAAVWGPRGRKQSRLFAAPGLINAAVNGEPPPTAHADDAIDMLYVKDCARAIALVQTAAQLAHSTYNVGSGRATSNSEVAAAIERAVPGTEIPLEPGRSPHGAVAYLDTARLQADTGFEPQYELDRALADYVSWLTNDQLQKQST